MVLSLPRLLATAWGAWQAQAARAAALGDGDILGVLARALAIVAVVVPVLGHRLRAGPAGAAHRARVWRRTAGGRSGGRWPSCSPRRSWPAWPGPGGPTPTATGRCGPTRAARCSTPSRRGSPSPGCGTDRSAARRARSGPPTPRRRPRRQPALALVLVPKGAAARAARTAGRPAWVFPFDRPLPPERGQPGAGGEHHRRLGRLRRLLRPRLGRRRHRAQPQRGVRVRQLHGLPTVAVAFQVVLLVGSVDVVVPQNLSAAVNYGCVQCVTYALAPAGRHRARRAERRDRRGLDALWREIQAFAASLQQRAAGPDPQPVARLPGPGQGAGPRGSHTGTRLQQLRDPDQRRDGDQRDPRRATTSSSPSPTGSLAQTPTPSGTAPGSSAADDSRSSPDDGGPRRAELLLVGVGARPHPSRAEARAPRPDRLARSAPNGLDRRPAPRDGSGSGRRCRGAWLRLLVTARPPTARRLGGHDAAAGRGGERLTCGLSCGAGDRGSNRHGQLGRLGFCH